MGVEHPWHTYMPWTYFPLFSLTPQTSESVIEERGWRYFPSSCSKQKIWVDERNIFFYLSYRLQLVSQMPGSGWAIWRTMESCHGWMEAHLTLWIGISTRRTFLEKSVGSYLPTLTGSIRLAMDREDSFANDRWEVSETTSSPSILPFPFHPPLSWWEEEEVALKEQMRIEQMTYFLRLHYACAHILDGRLLIGNKRCNWRWLKRNYRTKSILDVAKVLRADHLLRASGSVLQEVGQSISQSIILFICPSVSLPVISSVSQTFAQSVSHAVDQSFHQD